MRIRSVTAHADLRSCDRDVVVDLLADARRTMPAEVQTVRASTVPLTGVCTERADIAVYAADLAAWCEGAGLDYVGGFGLGTLPGTRDLAVLSWLPDILAEHPRLFSNCQIAWGDTVHLEAAARAAQVIRRLATVREGLGNLQFAALCNCGPYNPFYPASYASPERAAFTLSLEAADLAHRAFSRAQTLDEARESLVALLRDAYCGILSCALALEEVYGMAFYGADLTLAPSLEEGGSIARALECLGNGSFGESGTLFLSAFLADTIKSAGSEAGFCGLMYPVLEDAGIAESAAAGRLSLSGLLSYSAVCGTGLDCVPLPGDTTERTLTSLMLDVAGLSVRLGKPLTARLMPIPGAQAGDAVALPFSYFAPSRVMDPGAGGVSCVGETYTFGHRRKDGPR